jgi:hypothetical protein
LLCTGNGAKRAIVVIPAHRVIRTRR